MILYQSTQTTAEISYRPTLDLTSNIMLSELYYPYRNSTGNCLQGNGRSLTESNVQPFYSPVEIKVNISYII